MLKKIVLFLCCCLISTASLSIIAPPKVYFYDENCPSDKPFRGARGGTECLGCDELKSMRFDKENKADFDRCSNRETVETTDGIMRSRLKKCTESHPLRASDGSCFSCEELNKVRVENKADCNICPNRQTDGWGQDTYSCRLKKCPENFPLFSEGNCLACDAPYWTHDDKKTCDKCPNRQYIKIPLSQKIKNVVKGETPEGCYLRPEYRNREPLFEVKVIDYIRTSMWGNPYYQDFYSCNEKRDLETLPKICAECPNRNYKDGKCIFRECAEGSIESEDNEYIPCLWCDNSVCSIKENGDVGHCHDYPIKTTKEKCHRCPDRFWGISYSPEGEQCVSCKNKDDIVITTAEECARCPDFVYDPETKLCGTEESIQIRKRIDTMFSPRAKLDELELVPLPGTGEVVDFSKRPSLDTLELAPLPGVEETAIK